MKLFDITYRYTNPKAAISHVIATMTLLADLSAAELVALFESECADSNLRVIGVEAA